MEGDNSSSGLYRPCGATAQSQSLAEAHVRTVGFESHCTSMRGMDYTQLVAVPVAVVGLAAAAVKAGEHASAPVPAAEIETAALGTVGSVGQPVIEKRKRGRPPKGKTQPLKPPPPKKSREEEEDVCFICFDGGSLVLCDRKGCPKAYHPACIKRDEAFFRSKAKWNCGWHICSVCQKASYYMCYTCTYSLCKGCTRDAEYVCVRGNKGFCTTCMRTIMLIENKDTGNNESIQVDFDDKSSWEYLFKVYWVYLKSKLSLTLNELMEAKNPWQGVVALDYKPQPPAKINSTKGRVVSISDNSPGHLELTIPKEQPALPNQNSLSSQQLSSERSTLLNGCKEWASRDLLEFVAHMRNGDTSFLSQFDVQALLQDYIRINNLRDPRRKSQIICDSRLKNLFRKPRVGHIEMLKLLEYHFLIKEDTQTNAFIPAGIVGNVATHVGADHGNDIASNQNKKRKTRKKFEERAPQTNLDEYAAIDVHNINLIYLRRKLMENLLGDMEKFHDKVVGSIVRIRVSCNDQKQDIYRLVQVVGTSKTAEPYKIGDGTADIMLEVLNLNKKENISIDGISNQEFSEDECRRLRQSIKCGLVKRFTVGEIQIKAIALQAVRLNDWLEAEILRLNHLRDRANEKGRKKELRECVEKLQLLKTPEEHQRRLSEIPEVHADPKMNPECESEDDVSVDNDKKQGEFSRSRHSKFNVNGSQPIHPKRRVNEDGPVRTQQLDDKRDIQGPNSCPRHENQVVTAGWSSGCSNQAMVRSGLESSAVTSSSGNSPSADSSEMEKMWHYRDPNGKIQGPFSMVQLRKWSTTGYFPDDMRIWINNERDGCVLLTDALNGQLYKASLLLHNFSLQSQETDWNIPAVDKEMQPRSVESCDLSESKNSGSEHPPMGSPPQSINLAQTPVSPLNQSKEHEMEEFKSVLDHENKISHEEVVNQIFGGQDHDKPSSSQSCGVQSSGRNWRSLPLDLDLNHKDSNTGFAALAKSSDSSEGNSTDLLDLPSPTPKMSTGQPAEKSEFISTDVPAREAGMSDLPSPTPEPMDGDTPSSINPTDKDLPSHTSNPTDEDLPSPTPKRTDENQGGQIAEVNQSAPSKVSVQDSVPNLNSTGSLVVGGARLQEIANEWGRYSPTHAKQSIDEWDSSIVSMSSLKQSEEVGDQVAVPNTNGDPVTQSSPSQPASNLSSWPAVVNEPIIEFNTLAEESVSDLLAEVDAMESQSGLASPTSGMKYSDERNDCFSSIEELSPTPDAGKSDACSSGDIQFPSQPTVIDDPIGASHADAFDPSKRSGGHSTTSSEGETKPADPPVGQREAGSDFHPSQGMATGNMARGRGVDAMDTGWATSQGNMNMGWGGPAQGFSNMGWGPNVGTSWGNPNFNVGGYNGNVAWDSPRRYGGERYSGSRDWGFQASDVGYGRGRPMWSRQPHGGGGGSGGGGGGHSRPPPKGQRVCKFYESGHCKKGASCDYLHP